MLRAVRRLRVGELEHSGRDFRDAVEHAPVGDRQRQVGGGQSREIGPGRVGETKLKRAAGQPRAVHQTDGQCG